MPGKHDVYVFDDKKQTYVRPAVAVGIAGKPFKFRNLTNSTLSLKFPSGLMKEESPGPIPPQKSKTYHVRSNADGVYTYVVWSRRGGKNGKKKKKKRAIGESDPRIIIDF